MRALLAALILAVCPSCEALGLGSLKDPTPVTAADYAAFDALVADGTELVAGGTLEDALEVDWVSNLADVYTALRFAAGNPIVANPGEGPSEAAFREALGALTSGGSSVIETEDWARLAVRFYAAWRFSQGNPIPVPVDPGGPGG